MYGYCDWLRDAFFFPALQYSRQLQTLSALLLVIDKLWTWKAYPEPKKLEPALLWACSDSSHGSVLPKMFEGGGHVEVPERMPGVKQFSGGLSESRGLDAEGSVIPKTSSSLFSTISPPTNNRHPIYNTKKNGWAHCGPRKYPVCFFKV